MRVEMSPDVNSARIVEETVHKFMTFPEKLRIDVISVNLFPCLVQISPQYPVRMRPSPVRDCCVDCMDLFLDFGSFAAISCIPLQRKSVDFGGCGAIC